jgi:hypothetical protein
MPNNLIEGDHEWSAGKDTEEGRGLLESSVLSPREIKEAIKCVSQVVGNAAEIRTRNFPNTSLSTHQPAV